MGKRVAIIHYGLGNLQSVYNALEYLGANPFISSDPNDLKSADSAVLPGVGAFGDGMDHLRNNNWVEEIREFTNERKKPFIGLCLGMQLMATSGTEHGFHDGLDLIKGSVIKLSTSDQSIRIPHIGWNDVKISPDKRMYRDISAPHDYYFVHSYVFEPENQSVISATCNHGREFVASVEQDNIWGAQFHPEKSQRAGLGLLNNFLKYGE